MPLWLPAALCRIAKWLCAAGGRCGATGEPADINFARACGDPGALKDGLGIGDSVMEAAARIYKEAPRAVPATRGRPASALAASAVYVACRIKGAPRTLADVGRVVQGAGRRDTARCCRLLLREYGAAMPTADPALFIAWIAGRVGASERTRRHAAELLMLAARHGITSGRDPAGLAAAAVYGACGKCGDHRTRRDIARAAGVTKATIRNRCKALGMALDASGVSGYGR